MATKRFVSKDNLGRVWMRLFGKVLNSKEEIEANTSENMIAGADAVKEVYSSFAYDENGIYGYRRKVDGADTVFPFKSGILIPKLLFSISCSANSYVSGDSSVGTNTVSVSSSCSTKFTFSIESYSKLSIDSGTCNYKLTDSKGIASSKSGTLSANKVVDISDYDTLVLSSDINSSGRQVGTHNASASGTNSLTITNLKME